MNTTEKQHSRRKLYRVHVKIEPVLGTLKFGFVCQLRSYQSSWREGGGESEERNLNSKELRKSNYLFFTISRVMHNCTISPKLVVELMYS